MCSHYRCSSHNLVLGDFDNKITPYAGTGRIWTTLSTFKFYNSDFIYILCTVTVCPAASSSCDIVSILFIEKVEEKGPGFS